MTIIKFKAQSFSAQYDMKKKRYKMELPTAYVRSVSSIALGSLSPAPKTVD